MSGRYSRIGQRVDQIRVSDEPHDLYRSDGTPVLTDSTVGKIIEKEVTSFTVHCPSCDIPAYFTVEEEPVCPECGMICAGRHRTEVIREEDGYLRGREVGEQAPSGADVQS